jgi:hypothetical protein
VSEKEFVPHWTEAQCARLAELMDQGVAIAFWNSDAWGRACNGGKKDFRAAPGLIQENAGALKLCDPPTFHATREPHRWKGDRVWIVAMHGEVRWQEDKCGSLRREIIGEILPEEAIFSASVAIRLRANLSGAYLYGAYLYGANLTGANLTGAYLTGANLSRADLSGADLSGAYLPRADLSGAYLPRADLSGANLSGANLYRADLSGANLYGANRGAYSAAIPGWRTLATGYLEKDEPSSPAKTVVATNGVGAAVSP